MAPGCNQYQHPHLHPRQLGWQPDRDLKPFQNTDSLFAEVKKIRTTRAQLDSLLEWTDLLNYADKELALQYANEAYRLAVEKGFRFSQALAMYYRALLKRRGQIVGEGKEDALADAKISQRLTRGSDPVDWQVRIGGLLGSLFYQNRGLEGSYLDSARYFADAGLALLEKASMPEKEKAYLQGQLYQDLASTYRRTDSTQTIDYFQKGIQLAKLSQNDALRASIWSGLGLFFMEKENLLAADSSLAHSEKHALSSGDLRNLTRTYQALGDLKGRQFAKGGLEKYYFQSMVYLQKCLEIQTDNRFYTYELIGYNFGDRLVYLNGYPPRAYSPEGDSAIQFYKWALEEAQKEGALEVMSFMVENINVICHYKDSLTGQDCRALLGNEDYKDFLNHNYAALVDTVRRELKTSNQRIREFEEREQTANNERRIFNYWLVSGSIFFIAVILFLVFLYQQQKKKYRARLETLRAQINPHFMANSLNAIENLVIQDKKEAASKYLIHFSRLSRKLLNASRNPKSSLKEELKTLEHFLALEQLRFRDKLSYEIIVDPEIDTDQVMVPALILQPYVENAILHGIKPKSGPGKIKISASKEGSSLICEIEDDGIGREKALALKSKSSAPTHKSQGMNINKERLKIIGRNKGANIEIIDMHHKGNASGTKVIISMPYKLKTK